MSFTRNIIRSTITRLPREASRQFTNINFILKSKKNKDKDEEDLIILFKGGAFKALRPKIFNVKKRINL